MAFNGESNTSSANICIRISSVSPLHPLHQITHSPSIPSERLQFRLKVQMRLLNHYPVLHTNRPRLPRFQHQCRRKLETTPFFLNKISVTLPRVATICKKMLSSHVKVGTAAGACVA